jgi:hypothetical protein
MRILLVFFSSIDLPSFISSNHFRFLLRVLQQSLGFHIRNRISVFGAWRLCLPTLRIPSIAFASFFGQDHFRPVLPWL